jgi:hypothetical protein
MFRTQIHDYERCSAALQEQVSEGRSRGLSDVCVLSLREVNIKVCGILVCPFWGRVTKTPRKKYKYCLRLYRNPVLVMFRCP